MESQSPDSARVRSASARVAAISWMRISERKRTTRTPDPSKSARRNTETQRNSQRSLLEGGVGSVPAPVSALSLDIAIRFEWGNNSIIPPGSRQTGESNSSLLDRPGRPPVLTRIPSMNVPLASVCSFAPRQIHGGRPTVPLVNQETLRGVRPPSAAGVIRKIVGRAGFPRIEHRHQKPPRGLHLVGAHEQRGIVVDYVREQRHIGLRRWRS